MSSDEAFLEQVASALAEVRLEAIVVGNAGGALHNAPVLTRDVDLLIRDTLVNRRKLDRFAQAMGGAKPVPLTEFSRVLRIYAATPIDILFDEISGGLKFEALRSRSRRIRVGRLFLTVASLRDIIKSKEAAGRPKDIAALEILRSTLGVNATLQPERSVGKGRYPRRSK